MDAPRRAAERAVPAAAKEDESLSGPIQALAAAIAAVPLRDVKGWLCRAVRSKHLKDRDPPEPLYYLGSARSGARFTPVGGPAGLYLANHQDVALAELRDVVFGVSGKRRPLRRRDAVTLVTARVEVRGVLDLTDEFVRGRIAVTANDVTAEWASVMEEHLAGRGPLPLTQQIGLAAYLTGRVRAILFPSARHPDGECLCVFPDRLWAADGDVVGVSGTYRQRLP